MAKAVFCLARSEAQATMIVDQLKAAGFSNNDISVLFPDKTGTKDFAHEQHTNEGAWRRVARARAQVPRSAARRVPVSAWPAQSPGAGGRQRGV